MNNELLLRVQLTCFVITFMLAFVVLVGPSFVERRNRNYEQSRWMLFIAMSLMAVHYFMQMRFGFRAAGPDIGAIANFVFYAPVGVLICFSQYNLVRGGIRQRRYWIVATAVYVVMLAVIGFGRWRHDSWHIGAELYVADAIYILLALFDIVLPLRELRRISRRIDEEAGNSAETYLRCMKVGSILLYAFVLFAQLFLFSTPVICTIGPLTLLAFTYFIVCFVALGYNMGQVADIIEDEEREEESDKRCESVPQHNVLTDVEMETIGRALESWKTEGGMRDSTASIVSLARRIGVERQALTAYLNMQYGCTFRVWLSNLRTEEAKRLVLEHDDYSNEVIAFECGFSSASQLYRVFKTATGSTPREWREKQTRGKRKR